VLNAVLLLGFRIPAEDRAPRIGPLMAGRSTRETEILVAGGGPVGLAAAIEARLAGLDVIVVEPREGAIDKACGEGLMPGAVPALERLRRPSPRVPATRRRLPRRSPQRGTRFDAGNGLGVRRTTLHAALRARAEELGVRFVVDRWRRSSRTRRACGPAGGYRHDPGRLAARRTDFTPRWRAELGLALPTPQARRRYGQRRHYAVEPWSDLIEVHWTRAGEIYVTPTADGMVGCAAGRQGTHFDEAIARRRSCAHAVRGPASALRGAGRSGNGPARA
jgi:flavin-dependent dehydrogenase